INKFDGDTDEELAALRERCAEIGVDVACATHWANGGQGAVELAETVLRTIDANPNPAFKPLYADDLPLEQKLETLAREIYGARGIVLSKQARRQLDELVALGCDNLPVCVAKTQYSFSADPKLLGAPTDFDLEVRELRWSAGAGFVVALTGEIVTAPGLPRVPAAEAIDLDENGDTVGLF
ncbi:MAG: formate--tetrahydrofolate ligase, partial [Thermoguttaceae bacterium]|nr:formate--tetrahydrofolate ligase [Thermoguttaceae bacterium]